MALDRQTLVNKLRASGAFTESEIESEADTMMKDDRAAERRDTLNSTKVAAEPVATTQPAPAASVAPPTASVAPSATSSLSVPTVPAGTTAAQLVTGDVTPTGMGTPPEQRVKKVGENVIGAGGNLVQNSIDYFSTFPNYHPNITGAAAAVPIAYAAHKAAQATGLYDTLVSKMANSNAPAQPQPFVGGAGPRVTPPAPVVTPPTPLVTPKVPVVTPTASPIQNWDIHSDPSFGNFLGDAIAPATTAPAAPVNTKLEELKAKAAAGIPATGEFVGPMQPVGPPEFIGPRRPVVPTPPEKTAKPKPQLTAEQLNMKLPIGHGSGDAWLYNTLGPEKYHAFIEAKNNGKPFGDQYNAAQQAYQETYLGPKLPGSIAASREIARPASNFGAIPPEMQEVGPPTKEALQKLKPVKPPKSSMANTLVTPLTRGGYNPMTDNLEHALNPLKL